MRVEFDFVPDRNPFSFLEIGDAFIMYDSDNCPICGIKADIFKWNDAEVYNAVMFDDDTMDMYFEYIDDGTMVELCNVDIKFKRCEKER